MTHHSEQFTIVDPRTMDGDPYDVASRGTAQLHGIVEALLRAIPTARAMARNAELTRQLDRDEEPDPVGWEQSVEGRRWKQVEADLEKVRKDLTVLTRASGYNPKAPLNTK